MYRILDSPNHLSTEIICIERLLQEMREHSRASRAQVVIVNIEDLIILQASTALRIAKGQMRIENAHAGQPVEFCQDLQNRCLPLLECCQWNGEIPRCLASGHA